MVTLNPDAYDRDNSRWLKPLRAHRKLSQKKEAEQNSRFVKLREVYIPRLKRACDQYPHEFIRQVMHNALLSRSALCWIRKFDYRR